VHNSPVDRRITYTLDCQFLELPLTVIGHFIMTDSGLVLRIIFGTDSGIAPEPVSFILGTVLTELTKY